MRRDQDVGELGLTDHHLSDRAPVVELVLTDRLRQPALSIDTRQHRGDDHIAGRRSIDVAGSRLDLDLVDGHADRFGLHPGRQMNHDAFDIGPAVQLAQQDQQVVADGAGDTPVSQLQGGLGGGQHPVLQHVRGA